MLEAKPTHEVVSVAPGSIAPSLRFNRPQKAKGPGDRTEAMTPAENPQPTCARKYAFQIAACAT